MDQRVDPLAHMPGQALVGHRLVDRQRPPQIGATAGAARSVAEAMTPSGPPSAAHVLAHIEHALDVCGEDHVGIGSDQGIVPLDVGGDFTARLEEVSRQRTAAGIAAPREDTIPYVPDLNHPRRLETIADHMSARGHASRVIEKVLGANFMRLFEEVWG